MPETPPCSASCASWMASATLSTTHAQRMRLFRERAEHVAALLHDALSCLHLFFKGRVVRTDAIAVRRFGQKYKVTLLDLEFRRSFLGQHKANRVADLHELQGNHVALQVITYVITPQNGESRTWEPCTPV